MTTWLLQCIYSCVRSEDLSVNKSSHHSWLPTCNWQRAAREPWDWVTTPGAYQWIWCVKPQRIPKPLWKHLVQLGEPDILRKCSQHQHLHHQHNCLAFKKEDFVFSRYSARWTHTRKWFPSWQWLRRDTGEVIWYEVRTRATTQAFLILCWLLSTRFSLVNILKVWISILISDLLLYFFYLFIYLHFNIFTILYYVLLSCT